MGIRAIMNRPGKQADKDAAVRRRRADSRLRKYAKGKGNHIYGIKKCYKVLGASTKSRAADAKLRERKEAKSGKFAQKNKESSRK